MGIGFDIICSRKRIDCRRLLTRFWLIYTIVWDAKKGKGVVIMSFLIHLVDWFKSLFPLKKENKNTHQLIIIINGNIEVSINTLKK